MIFRPQRPWRLAALRALLLACASLGHWGGTALGQTPPPPPKPAAAPATPVVAAPQKPNAQRPANPQPGHGQPAKPAANAPLPAPPVPPSEIPPVHTGPTTTPETPAEPAKGSSTGAPIPRYAALRSDDVNFRVGPGTRYPIEWTYKRKDLPVLIERELDVWRLVRDPEGTRGWVHVATLTTRRSFMVTEAERTLRRSGADDARAVAKLQPGVIGFIRSCKAGVEWCQVQVGEHRGWLKRNEFWGTLPNEAVN